MEIKDIEKQCMDAYEEYADELFRYCFFRLSDREQALDMVQEIFVRFWNHLAKSVLAKDSEGDMKDSLISDLKNINRRGEIENIRAFLYKIATHLVIDEYRRRGKRPKSESLEVLQEAGFDIGIQDEYHTEEYAQKVEALRLIKSLPEPYDETIFLRFVQGLSVKEVAQQLNESENVISVRIHRGLEKLKKMVELQKDSTQHPE